MRPQEYSILNRDPKDFTGPTSLKIRLLSVLHELAYPPLPKLLDLSRYQSGDTINPKEIKAAGYVGVILQATYGAYVDTSFSHFWRIFLDEGFIVMTYHLFWATLSGFDQADKHLETIAPLWSASGVRWPAWDDIEVRDGVPVPTRQTRADDWRHEVRKETTPGTYCSYSLWDELMGGISLGDQLGWQAAWNPYYDFMLCRGWKEEQTLLRQKGAARKHSWVEIVPGCSGDVDVNEFRGTLEELYLLAGETPPEPPSPEDNMTALQNLKAGRSKLAAALVDIDAGIAELESGTPPTPPPTPPPADDTWLMTTKTQTKAWCFEVWNEKQKVLIEKRNGVRNAEYPKGQPIMQDYRDSDGNLKILPKGTKILTIKKLVNADGSRDYYECVTLRGDHNQRLFLWKDEVAKPY